VKTAVVTGGGSGIGAAVAGRPAHYPAALLVDATGRDSLSRFLDISFEDWKKIVDIKLHEVFHTIQAVLPDMTYVAAKSGVIRLTKSLALEYGPAGITGQILGFNGGRKT